MELNEIPEPYSIGKILSQDIVVPSFRESGAEEGDIYCLFKPDQYEKIKKTIMKVF